jgi:dTDP-glucose pyrophosphorylase
MSDKSAVSLLLLVGGLGSRFGGTKQLATVGPQGSAILDYSIREAAAVGVTRVVVVGRTDLDSDIQSHLASQHGEDLNLVMVHQDAFGPTRVKPWGTGHAVVSARAALDGPVVVLNVDDHYGSTGIARILKSLSDAESTVPSAAMLGFQLGRTIPETGTVSRGVCTRDGTGRLNGLVETPRYLGAMETPSGQSIRWGGVIFREVSILLEHLGPLPMGGDRLTWPNVSRSSPLSPWPPPLDLH